MTSMRLRNKLSTVHEPVIEAYRNGATIRAIADIYNVSPGTVRNLLIEEGETMRSRGRRKKIETIDPRILPAIPPSECAEDCENCTCKEEPEAPDKYEGRLF